MTKQFLLSFQGLLLIFISPLILGWMKKMKCWLQQRNAPSIFQPYYSVYKLLLKEPVVAHNASWLFRFAPYANISLLIAICFSLPFFIANAAFSQQIDVIVIVGLLGLARVILALAAMDIGTAFGSLGSRREMFVACLSEPVLLVIFYNIRLLTHSPYISESTLFFLQHLTLYPSLAFSLLALLLILLAETGRIPIDNPATHLELTMIHEAMVLEYSGRYLALIELSQAIKFTIFLSFIIALFLPMGLHWEITTSNLLVGFSSSLIKLFLLTSCVAIIESINCKIRIFKIPDYLAGAFMLSVLGVLITQVVGVAA